MITWFVPVVAVALVAASDLWVYLDARRCAAEGSPVVLRIGAFAIDTPVAWLAGCVVLWIVVFPIYLMGRIPRVTAPARD